MAAASDSEGQKSFLIDAKEWNLLNRSYSVDTDHYMRHLQGKSKNYDVLRGIGDEPSKHHLSKLERQMNVMDFMENSRK